MLDTIIITGLGVIILIETGLINKLNYKLDILETLHKYHNALVSFTEMYINKEVDIVNYNYMVNKVKEHIKEIEEAYFEDNK